MLLGSCCWVRVALGSCCWVRVALGPCCSSFYLSFMCCAFILFFTVVFFSVPNVVLCLLNSPPILICGVRFAHFDLLFLHVLGSMLSTTIST